MSSRCFHRLLLWLAAFGLVCSGLAPLSAALKDEAPAAKGKTYSPELEKKLAEFFKKAGEARRKLWDKQLAGRLADLDKLVALSAEQRETLNTAGQKAIDESLSDLLAKLELAYRHDSPANRDPVKLAAELDKSLRLSVESWALPRTIGSYCLPEDQAVWTDAFRQVLKPDQAAKWETRKKSAEEALKRKIAELLKKNAEFMRNRVTAALGTRGAEMSLALSLPPARTKELDDLIVAVGDAAVAAWVKNSTESLLKMKEAQRESYFKTGRYTFLTDDILKPTENQLWKAGLARLLSSEEVQRMETESKARNDRRVHALGQMLLLTMDEKVAFTEQQRAQLQPLAERLMKAESNLFPPEFEEIYYTFAMQVFRAAAKKAGEKDLRPILTPEQWRRWQAACARAEASQPDDSLPPRQASPAAQPLPPPARPWEPEDSERAISEFLAKRAALQGDAVHAYMTLQVEDAVRVAGLSSENAVRLRSAAHGAAEAWLAQWRIQFEQWLRSEIPEANPRTIKARLDGIDVTDFSRIEIHGAAKHPRWTATVAHELTPSQMTVWQKEVDRRKAFRVRAIAGVLLAEFDRKTLLSGAQCEKIAPRVVELITKFESDIQDMYSFSGDTEWYQENWTMLLPLAGMTDELTATLAKAQMDRWKGSSEFTNAASHWANIEQRHRSRTP